MHYLIIYILNTIEDILVSFIMVRTPSYGNLQMFYKIN
jgi:hypothetical protein